MIVIPKVVITRLRERTFVEHVKTKARLHIVIIVCLICGNQRVEMKMQGFISARNARRIGSN
jgi:hypothetical protein